MNGFRNWDLEQWLTPGRFGVLLGLLVFSIHPDVLLGSHSFFYRDFSAFGYPLASYHRESFWQGSVPLWNPLNNCGLPHAAQWNTMVFYPLSLIYLLLPLPWSLNLFCLAHLWLAGLAMYFLARRWTGSRLAAGVAGIGFALNGVTLHSLMWPNNIAALAWFPVVVLLAERAWRNGGRWLILAALAGAVQMLAGAPEIILFTWGFTGLLCLVWAGLAIRRGGAGRRVSGRAVWRFGLVVALVAGLAAVQMLPFIDLMHHSHRDRGFSTDVWAMPGWGWANLLVPLFHNTVSIAGVYSQDDQQWTSSYYLGIGLLALSVLAVWRCRDWRIWVLGGVTAFSLIMALGENSPVYPAVKRWIPAIGFARFPVKFVALAVFTVPLLAAFAVARREKWSLGGERVRVWLTGGAFLLLILLLIWFAGSWPVPDEAWEVTLGSGVTRALFLLGMLGILLGWNRLARRISLGMSGLALLLLAGLDPLTHAPRQNPTVESWVFDPGLHLAPQRPAVGGGARAMVSPHCQAFLDYAATPDAVEYYMGHRRALLPNGNMLESVPLVNGFYSLYSREQREVWSLIYRSGRQMPEPLLDFLGVTQISSDDRLFAWNSRPQAMPLVSAGQRPIFASPGDVLVHLGGRKFDPRTEVYLPKEVEGSVQARGGAARVLSSRVTSQGIEAEIDAGGASIVTVAQSAFPGWKAEVDGREVPLLRANHAFQAIEVPAGRHQVRLTYEDRAFQIGAWISGLTLLGCAGTGWMLRRRPTVEKVERWQPGDRGRGPAALESGVTFHPAPDPVAGQAGRQGGLRNLEANGDYEKLF